MLSATCTYTPTIATMLGWLLLFTSSRCFYSCYAQPVTPPTPRLNDVCRTAISVDPSNEIIIGNNTNARQFSFPPGKEPCVSLESEYCGSRRCTRPSISCDPLVPPSAALYYKISNESRPIIVSYCNNQTAGDTTFSLVPVRFYVLSGECGNYSIVNYNIVHKTDFLCPVYSDLHFYPKADKNYWIFAYTPLVLGEFAFTVTTDVSSFIAFVDPKTDQVTEKVSDVPYYIDYFGYYFGNPIGLSRFNFQAFFAPEIPTQSVRVTFNNPRRIFCEKSTPYSVFGDINGDFFSATLQVGLHVVTATPYAQANCTGPPGKTISERFYMYGCSFNYALMNTQTNATALSFSRPIVNVTSIPCRVYVQANVYCGYNTTAVRMEIRDAANGQVVQAGTDRLRPYLFYGKPSEVGLPGFSLSPGTYNFMMNIDGVQHQTRNLTISGDCYN
jgi:hypothetical protein